MAEQAEMVSVAVPVAADSFTNIGTIRAPAGMKRIRDIVCCIAPDVTVAANSNRIAPVFRLQGSGLLEQSPHDYLGNFGGHFVLTDEGSSYGDGVAKYKANIPVSVGGDIVCSVNTLDEVIAAGTAQINLIFDDVDPAQENSMADQVNAAGPTTAGAFANIGTLIVPEGKEGAKPTKIKELVLAVGVDQGVLAFALRLATQFRISGSGLVDPGLHVYAGPQGGSGIVVIGGSYVENGSLHIPVDLTVNAAGEIDVEMQYITETPTASTVAVGVLYE